MGENGKGFFAVLLTESMFPWLEEVVKLCESKHRGLYRVVELITIELVLHFWIPNIMVTSVQPTTSYLVYAKKGIN